MSGRQGEIEYPSLTSETVLEVVIREHDDLYIRPAPTGGKKKPLKAPKKERKDIDEVRRCNHVALVL